MQNVAGFGHFERHTDSVVSDNDFLPLNLISDSYCPVTFQ